LSSDAPEHSFDGRAQKRRDDNSFKLPALCLVIQNTSVTPAKTRLISGTDAQLTTHLLGPGLFDRFVLPHLARLVDLGYAYGLRVHLHCCGGIAPPIPSTIRAGLDRLHAVQPSYRGMDLAVSFAELNVKGKGLHFSMSNSLKSRNLDDLEYVSCVTHTDHFCW